MAGVNTGSSMMKRFAGGTNALAQRYGGDMAGAARGSSALLNRRPQQPTMPRVQNGIPGNRMPGQMIPMPSIPQMPQMGNPISAPPLQSPVGGINTAPTSLPFSPMGSPGLPPGAMDMNPMGQNPMGGGGIFDRYSNMGMHPNRRY